MSFERHLGGHRSVTVVVVPPVVVRVGGERLPGGHTLRMTEATEHQQPALVVGARLTEQSVLAEELPAGERCGLSIPAQGARPRVDHQRRAIGDVPIAQRRTRIEAVELVECGLVIRHMDRPRDCRIAAGYFTDKPMALVVAVEPKAGGLAFDPSGLVLERPRMGDARRFGPDEELVRTIAQTGDAQSRKDSQHYDGQTVLLPSPAGPSLPGEVS